jgi:hypothetical protein
MELQQYILNICIICFRGMRELLLLAAQTITLTTVVPIQSWQPVNILCPRFRIFLMLENFYSSETLTDDHKRI